MSSKPVDPLRNPPEAVKKFYKTFSIIVLVILSIALLAGGGLLLFDLSDISTAKDSERWPSVEGSIDDSSLVETTSSKSNEQIFSGKVRYHFLVEGKEYQGRKIRIFAPIFEQRSEAETLIAQYPIGENVPVFFDPENPGRSVLEPGFYESKEASTTKSFVVLAITLAVLVFLIVIWRKPYRGPIAVGLFFLWALLQLFGCSG